MKGKDSGRSSRGEGRGHREDQKERKGLESYFTSVILPLEIDALPKVPP